MALVPRTGYCALWVLTGALTLGCRAPQAGRSAAAPSISGRPVPTTSPQVADAAARSAPRPAAIAPLPPTHPPLERNPITPVAHRAAVPVGAAAEAPDDGLFAGQGELPLDQLTELVLARNASLQAMTFAWQSATQRYPQAISLDDPIFMGMIAPASVNSSTVETGYQVGASQRLPWFGKRAAKGAVASADASAMFHDVRDARLQLAQSTRAAFFEYYLVARELEINRSNLDLTREFRRTAQSKYENNQVTEQDVLQADVELATTERRLLEFERMQRVAQARINALLRREPDQWLPPPPATLEEPPPLPPVMALRQIAVTQRPDLAAIGARVRSEQAAVELAHKQFFPDTELYGRYDSFWQPASTQGPLRGQVGVNVNMPVYRNKLKAAVSEAEFRLSQRQAEYSQKLADVQFDVESAYAQTVEAEQAIDLYRHKVLPATEQTVATTRANYDAGTTTFLNLLTAQQQLLRQREQFQQTLAAYQVRLAELERAIGGPLPEAYQPEPIATPLPE